MKELEKAVLAVMLGEAPLHPNQQKIDVVDDEKIDAKDFAKLRAMKKNKNGKIHSCAVHVEHPEYGTGLCISEAHADPDENGDVAWYTVKFDTGTHVVQTKDVKIIAAESHMHEGTRQVDEARFKKGEDVGKPGMNFAKIAKSAAKRYGSEEAGKRVAGAVLKKVLAKEEVEYTDDEIETVLNNFEHLEEMSKSMAYATGTKKAMQMTGDKPPLEKSTIKKGHEIAKAMLKKEEVDVVEGSAKYGDRGVPGTHKNLSRDSLDPKYAAGHRASVKTRIKRRLGKDEYGDIRASQGGPRSFDYNKKSNLPEEEQFTDYDELIEAKPFEYEIQENYNFGDYLKTAKQLVGEEEAINLANQAYNAKNTDLFLEAVGREDIEAKVKMHSNAGHKVSTPKYSTKGGEFHAEYVVTDKESGIRRKYIHHGSSRKVENMGAAGKRD